MTKALSDTGMFSGYASIFGNVDSGNDIVERNAFQEIVKTKDGHVRLLYQHDSRQPIGKAVVKQDDKGLYFEAQLVLGMTMARNAYEGLKAGILDGMSIGYDVLPGGSEMTNAGIRKLTSLKLWEISLVTFPMNTLATVESVKAVSEIKTRREFEDYLRDAGFSANQAKSIASCGWKDTPESQSRDVSDEVKRITEVVAGLKFTDCAPAHDVPGLIDTINKLSI
jgi:hypothetical protein